MGSNLATRVPVAFGWKIDKHTVMQFEAVHLTAAKFGRGAEKKTNKKKQEAGNLEPPPKESILAKLVAISLVTVEIYLLQSATRWSCDQSFM